MFLGMTAFQMRLRRRAFQIMAVRRVRGDSAHFGGIYHQGQKRKSRHSQQNP
jgi:hypothetical protein